MCINDIYILFKGTNRQAEFMVNSLNQNNENIYFILEIRIYNKINFLDLAINKTNNAFNLNIYGKLTKTDTIFLNYSISYYFIHSIWSKVVVRFYLLFL